MVHSWFSMPAAFRSIQIYYLMCNYSLQIKLISFVIRAATGPFLPWEYNTDVLIWFISLHNTTCVTLKQLSFHCIVFWFWFFVFNLSHWWAKPTLFTYLTYPKSRIIFADCRNIGYPQTVDKAEYFLISGIKSHSHILKYRGHEWLAERNERIHLII